LKYNLPATFNVVTSRIGEEYYQAVTTILKSEDEENKVYSITYDLSGV
jgi:hypothetical protein